MKLATWNVNSLKVRLPQVLDWLTAHQPDALCLQETKLEDDKFPVAEIEAAGYRAAFSGQKTYNGVAVLTRKAVSDVSHGIPGFNDPQKRVIAATLDGVRVVCGYMPNGESVESDKYRYKLEWYAALTNWLRDEVSRHPQLALLGDFNIAPADADVHDPQAWAGKVLCSDAERNAFQGLLALGLSDTFRLFEQPERSFSWWDYRMNAFRRKMGLRIDHILASGPLAGRCKGCLIDSAPRANERPSDHAPVIAEFATI
ncbi:MAG: exodeoxyribonuclease III [Burkholderiales bacterium]|nr:exodeoxyribonuclease III [Burkholderiales bacterium]MCW5605020.1 exodeoxyribonuclease III [Burkholderiales bacterium]